jgi:two-component system CheB/CheR fusion protein
MFYDNEIQGYVGVLVDVSDQMEAAKAVKELLRKKDEFLSIASHELKTPLTSIKASTQLLGELLKAGEQELLPQYLKKADKQLDKLVQLINELLDVSKIDAGKMDMHYEAFDAAELLETTKEYLLASNKKYAVEIFAVTHPIVADKGRIEQVIYNFLSNAVKYSPANEELSISITGNEHSFKFSVKDTGTGIPKEKLNLIFERFYRVDESGVKPGLGLGLYISSEIIKKHNGFITVESEMKKGSVFSFTVPFRDLKK